MQVTEVARADSRTAFGVVFNEHFYGMRLQPHGGWKCWNSLKVRRVRVDYATGQV